MKSKKKTNEISSTLIIIEIDTNTLQALRKYTKFSFISLKSQKNEGKKTYYVV